MICAWPSPYSVNLLKLEELQQPIDRLACFATSGRRRRRGNLEEAASEDGLTQIGTVLLMGLGTRMNCRDQVRLPVSIALSPLSSPLLSAIVWTSLAEEQWRRNERWVSHSSAYSFRTSNWNFLMVVLEYSPPEMGVCIYIYRKLGVSCYYSCMHLDPLIDLKFNVKKWGRIGLFGFFFFLL